MRPESTIVIVAIRGPKDVSPPVRWSSVALESFRVNSLKLRLSKVGHSVTPFVLPHCCSSLIVGLTVYADASFTDTGVGSGSVRGANNNQAREESFPNDWPNFYLALIK